MIDYNDIKDIVINIDPITGKLTIDEFLILLEKFLNDETVFLKTIEKVLKKNKANLELADRILDLSSLSSMKFLIKFIKDEL